MATSESIVQLPEGKVKLVSGDGFEFIIDEEAARVSSTIRGMLDSQGNNFYVWSVKILQINWSAPS